MAAPRPIRDAGMSALRPSFIDIDTEALVANMRRVRERIGPACRFFAVIKGDGYGIGALPAARAAVEAGADALATGNPDIVPVLRQAGIGLPVLLYPATLPSQAAAVAALGVIPTLHDGESLDAFAGLGLPLDIYAKVDCGNGRLGVPIEEAAAFFARLKARSTLRLAGLYAQFRNPDDARDVAAQAERFARFRSLAEAAGHAGFEVMVSSSILVADHPELDYTAVNPGRMLYGFMPSEALEAAGLKRVITALRTHIIQLRTVPAGEALYGSRIPLDAPRRVAAVPLGFMDGLNAAAPAHVALVRGQRVPVVGSRSMEHMVLDVTGLPEVRVGDEAVFLGRQGGEEISPEELGRAVGLSPIEMMPRLGRMASRRYFGSPSFAAGAGASSRRVAP